jgi:hypothetical protein
MSFNVKQIEQFPIKQEAKNIIIEKKFETMEKQMSQLDTIYDKMDNRIKYNLEKNFDTNVKIEDIMKKIQL